MICERCHKNQAAIHMTKIINGEKQEEHLCGECAAKEGFDSPISFQDIFQGLLGMAEASMPIQEGKAQTKAHLQGAELCCSNCGQTFEEFRKTGKLGCANCYKAFRPYLDSVLTNIQARNIHRGKLPKRSGVQLLKRQEKQELKRKLSIAIQEEEFEEAARLRDKIRELEKEG